MSGKARNRFSRLKRASTLVFAAALFTLLFSQFASATTPAISQATADVAALSKLVDQLNEELGAATEEYNLANEEYEQTKAAAEATADELAQASMDMMDAQDRLDERLVAIYKGGDLTAIDILLNAQNMADLLESMDTLKWVAEQDAELIQEIKSFRDEKADLKVQLEADLAEQEVQKEAADTARQKVLTQLEKQRQALKGKEAQLAQLRKAERERQARLAAEAARYQAWLKTRPGQAVAMAKSYLGVPYVWGGSSPSGFDCSGLVQYIYGKLGVSLPHSSRLQYNYGSPVSRSNLRAGDLVFFYSPIHHVGIYVGGGRMIDATGNRVQYSDVFRSSYVGARRVL